MNDFPRHLDTFLAVDQRLPDSAAAMVAGARRKHAAPYAAALVAAYVRARLRSGRVYVYGVSGPMTPDILDAIASRPDIELAGFVDRRALDLVASRGVPVLLPSAIPGDDSTIVLSNWIREDEMRATLMAHGVAERRIFGFGSSDAFEQWGVPAEVERLRQSAGPGIDTCIISANNAERGVLPDDCLAKIFDPRRTFRIAWTRNPDAYERVGRVYPRWTASHSAEALYRYLAEARPSRIYVATTPHVSSQYLGLLAKMAVPEAFVAHEFYDWALLFGDRRMRMMGFSDDEVAWSYLAEAASCASLDLIVGKNGGASWEHLVGQMRAPWRLFYPAISPYAEPPAAPPPSGGPMRVIYGGSLAWPGRVVHPDADFFPLFESFSGDGVITDVYNDHHRQADQDEIFAPYEVRYPATGPVRYHRGIEAKDLHTRMAGYDFGFVMGNHADGTNYVHLNEVVLPNKVGTYIWSGVPLLVDERTAFVADLVRQFDAGVVIGNDEFGSVRDRLLAADRPKLRAGVRRLRAHLIAENRLSMTALEQAFGLSPKLAAHRAE